jgi:hypothetical protein
VKEVEIAEGSVYMHWGTAEFGDRAKDIRSRTFALLFCASLSLDARQSLIDSNAVLFRARYDCNSACKRDLAAEAEARGKLYVPKSICFYQLPRVLQANRYFSDAERIDRLSNYSQLKGGGPKVKVAAVKSRRVRETDQTRKCKVKLIVSDLNQLQEWFESI